MIVFNNRSWIVFHSMFKLMLTILIWESWIRYDSSTSVSSVVGYKSTPVNLFIVFFREFTIHNIWEDLVQIVWFKFLGVKILRHHFLIDFYVWSLLRPKCSEALRGNVSKERAQKVYKILYLKVFKYTALLMSKRRVILLVNMCLISMVYIIIEGVVRW